MSQSEENAPAVSPPPEIQAWMDRLTVEHEYDPSTGFIVAKETIGLPEVIRTGPPIAEAIEQGQAEGRVVIAFATADRCAPCQQFKKSALNDPRVIEKLDVPGLIVTHVEVDQQPEAAQAAFGSLAIPMTYAFSNGERVAALRGQRTPDELLEWLELHAEQ